MLCVKLVNPIFVIGSSNFEKKKPHLIMKLWVILLAQVAPERESPCSVNLNFSHDIFEVVTSVRCFYASGE